LSVCIAVLPQFTDKIVMVSDQMLSSDTTSVDGTMKVSVIAGTNWNVMFAGNPARFKLLMDRVRDLLGDVRNTRLAFSTVTAALERAYALELQKLIENEILLPYGMARDDFIQNGKELLGDRFYQLMDQISSASLGVEVIVAGADPLGETTLSWMTNGVVMPAALPYHAIGSGSYTALASLYQLNYFPTHDLSEIVYRACAAKFAAENVPSVGRATYAIVIAALSGDWTLITNIEQVRELWRTKGQPPIPSAARRLIERDLRSLGIPNYPR
jgi:ATP-dependent protease HslVU (ClpYQ) peptidase subunit